MNKVVNAPLRLSIVELLLLLPVTLA